VVVPNYVPDPIEIPDNVTEQPYAARLKFIREMQCLQIVSIMVVLGLASIPQIPVLPPIPVAIVLFAFLIGLCLIRIGLRRTPREAKVSTWTLPILLVLVAVAARTATDAGVEIWAAVVGPVFAFFYMVCCSRDFSFVGQYVLSLIASSVAIASVSLLIGHTGAYAGEALAINAAFLTYFVYDGASLLSRRRVGEQLATVVDLYRDCLNIFGFIPRVVQHWHKHRIWQLR